MILLASLLILLILFLVGFWGIFIHPLFTYENKLSHEIREAVFPSIIDIDKTIITIASAAIVLTVQLLKEPSLVSKEYLISSWITFSLSILVGIITLIAHYTHRFTDKIMLSEVNKAIDKKTPLPEVRELKELMRKQQSLRRILFVSIYLQTVFLFISMVSLVAFGVQNLLK